MTTTQFIFGLMAVFALSGGLGVVISRNLFHAALYLVLSLFGIAGLFVLLEAPFLAAVQILVYVGAISVLITITIMVTRRVMGSEALNRQWPVAAVVSALIMVTLGFVMVNQFGGITDAAAVPGNNLEMLGHAFVNPAGFLLPFEVASVLLLAALIGAIVIARD